MRVRLLRGGMVLLAILTVPIDTSRAETLIAEYRSPADRALAVTWLGRMRSRAALDTLLRLCEDPDGGVRAAAVEALGEIADPASVPAVRRLALDGARRAAVRATALVVWARLDGAGALADVLRIFREPPGKGIPDPPWFFGPFPRFVDPDQRPPVVAFPSCWHGDVRVAAARALADIGGDAAREAFCEHLFRAETLSMGLAWEIHRTVPEALEEWSARRVSSEDPAIRRNAVAIRYVLYPGDSADAAHAVLTAEDDPLLVGTITFLRGHAVGDPRISRALRRHLRAASGASCNDRLRLVDALGRQGDEIAELALVQFAATGRIRLR